jgi:hypothetical protein
VFTPRRRTLMLGSAALVLFSFTALTAGEAQAGGWHVHVEARPVVVVRPYYPPPPPPPPVWRYAPPPVVYAPPRVVYVPRPAPPVVIQAAPVQTAPMNLGLSFSGVVQEPTGGEPTSGGVSFKLQSMTWSRSMLFLELQGVTSPRTRDGFQRQDGALLLGTRLFLLDGPLTPYLEVAGGLGASTFTCCGEEMNSEQLVGRYGIGLELRLGQHLAFEAQVGQIHRWNYRTDDPTITRRTERALELHGGLSLRF